MKIPAGKMANNHQQHKKETLKIRNFKIKAEENKNFRFSLTMREN